MTDAQELSPDIAYAFLHAAPELDAVDSALRASGYVTLADNLLKLQADIGLQFVGNDASPCDGPQTAALLERREGNAASRMDRILRECHGKLRAPALKEWMTLFMAEVHVSPASVEPQSGERMTDGTVYAGSLDGREIYAMPEDAKLTYTFNEAAEYAAKLNREKYLGHDDWRVPTQDELNVLFQNRAAIGGFDESGDGTDAYYWSSLKVQDIMRSQRFSDGQHGWNGPHINSSLRCVRG